MDLLVGEGIVAEDLNSDSLGKALDYLYEAGITEVFAAVSAQALRTYGITVQFAHVDTTAFSLEGAYEFDADETTNEPETHPIRITYGHSKDHRPDLKQAIVSLICANQSSIPLYLSALSGNTADKTSLPQFVQTYLAQFAADEAMPVLVVQCQLRQMRVHSGEKPRESEHGFRETNRLGPVI